MTLSSVSANDNINYTDDYTSDIDLIENENTIVKESNLDDENNSHGDNQLNNYTNLDNFSINSTNNSSSNRGYTIIQNNLEKYYGNPTPFSITILDSNNVGVSGISVTFSINGGYYLRTTNSLGIASVAINLNTGTYGAYTTINDFSVTYYRHITILPTITGNDITKYYKNGTQYLATFRDTSGNLLTNTAVTFNINGVIYTRTTNSYGVGQLNINLNPGTYIITATNPVSNEQHSNTITVLPTLTASDLVMNYGDGSQFKAYLVNGQGNPYPGQTVQFNINGVFYNRVTNSNGIASLNINLPRGTYIITSSHNGLSISNHIYVN